MASRKVKPYTKQVKELMADKSRILSKAAAFEEMELAETARPLWSSAASYEERIAPLLDILGRRWVLRILWELRNRPLRSRALRSACGEISPSVRQKRIDELRQAGFVSLEDGEGYALTPTGQDLLGTFGPLTKWAEDWQENLR